MDDFSLHTPFDGDPARALDMVATTLSSNGFRILSRNAHAIEFKGPPPPQHIGEMNPYWGASRAVISQKGGALNLNAEMGEFNRTNKNASWIAVGILLMGVFAAISVASATGDRAGTAIMLAIMPTLALLVTFVIRWSAGAHERRTRERYETLLNNAAMMGRVD